MAAFLECAALLFDLDGVLVDSRAVVERTWRRWALRHDLDAERLIRVAHGRRASDTLREMCPDLPLVPEVAWLDAAELADVEGLTAIPGAQRLLERLSGVPHAIVTSCSRALAERRLAAAGLSAPPVMVTSDEVTLGKPAPEGYARAAAILGVTPSSCIVFEDAPAGIAAGRAAGCRVVALATTHDSSRLTGALHVIPDLTRIRLEDRGRTLAVEIAGA